MSTIDEDKLKYFRMERKKSDKEKRTKKKGMNSQLVFTIVEDYSHVTSGQVVDGNGQANS